MAEFDHMSGEHNALLREATNAHRDHTPADAAEKYAATLHEKGREADAEVLEAYAVQTRTAPTLDLGAKRQRLAEVNAEIEELRSLLAKQKITEMKEAARLTLEKAKRQKAARAEAERLIAEHASGEQEADDGMTPEQRAVYRQFPTLRREYGLT